MPFRILVAVGVPSIFAYSVIGSGPLFGNVLQRP